MSATDPADFFAMFGLDRQYQVDPEAIDQRYRQLSSGIDPAQRSRLDEARAVLSDPVRRGDYLLDLLGAAPAYANAWPADFPAPWPNWNGKRQLPRLPETAAGDGCGPAKACRRASSPPGQREPGLQFPAKPSQRPARKTATRASVTNSAPSGGSIDSWRGYSFALEWTKAYAHGWEDVPHEAAFPTACTSKDPSEYPLFTGGISRWIWRIYTQRFTPAGRWFLLGTSVFVMYGGASLQLQGYVLAGYAMALWGVAVIAMLFYRPRVKLWPMLPGRVAAGQTLQVDLEVEQLGRWRGSRSRGDPPSAPGADRFGAGGRRCPSGPGTRAASGSAWDCSAGAGARLSSRDFAWKAASRLASCGRGAAFRAAPRCWSTRSSRR